MPFDISWSRIFPAWFTEEFISGEFASCIATTQESDHTNNRHYTSRPKQGNEEKTDGKDFLSLKKFLSHFSHDVCCKWKNLTPRSHTYLPLCKYQAWSPDFPQVIVSLRFSLSAVWFSRTPFLSASRTSTATPYTPDPTPFVCKSIGGNNKHATTAQTRRYYECNKAVYLFSRGKAQNHTL